MGDFVSWILVIALGIAWLRGRRDRERDRQLWLDLEQRVEGLERALSELRREFVAKLAGSVPSFPAQSAPAAGPPVPTVEDSHPEPAPPVLASFPVEPSPSPPVAVSPTAIPSQPYAATQFMMPELEPTLLDRLKGGLDLEEALGANWLNKIGIVILVIGVALFLAYQLRQVGPAGKVLVGVVVSVSLLASGIWLERKPGYRVLGHAGIGGGWALTFFTAYAMYHVEATRVFSSQLPDLLLMAAVAAVMVVHTLRYRSQVVTGLAFLLAFTTLTISQVTVFSLTAEVILALGLVVIVGRMQWFELEVFGILAAYGSHWWWVSKIIEPMGEHKQVFPEFSASAAILFCYWAIFRASYILRRCDDRQEKISSLAALLNSALLLGVMKYQSVHPEWAFWALLALGIAELLLAMLPVTRRRRAAFLILATIGVTLLVAALPFRFSGASLDLLWLLEAETLLLAGIIVREVLFRRLGMIASVLVPLYVLLHEAPQLLQQRVGGLAEEPSYRLAVLCAFAAAAFFANSHIVLRRWPDLFEQDTDHLAMYCSSFVGAAMLFVGAWAAFPGLWTAVAWAVIGLALLLLGSKLKLDQLPLEAHFYFACALLAAINTNLSAATLATHKAVSSAAVCLVAAAFYVGSRWSASSADSWPGLKRVAPPAYRWAGSVLLLLLVPCALRPLSTAPAWVVLGLVLMESGLAADLGDLRAQGYLALAGAFGAIFFINLNAEYAAHLISARVYTVLPAVLALYYVYGRLTTMDSVPDGEARFRIATGAAWFGIASLAALLRFELDIDWVAAAWAACSVALLAMAWRYGRDVFLQQGLVLAFVATFRAALHNLYQRSNLPGPFWHSGAVCTGATAGLLFAGLWFAFRLRRRFESEQITEASGTLLRRLFRRPEQVFFFLPLALVVALLAVEMRAGLITVSWSALGVLVFLFALWVGERSFRLAGLGLLLLGVGKIMAVDVWELNPRDRYLTFICMGCALLLVSFLYSRYREAIRRYL